MKVRRGKYLKKVIAMLLMTLLFSNLSVFAAEIGKPLGEPEAGWVRFDDTNSNITYNGTWITEPMSGFYNDAVKYSNITDSNIEFNFTGPNLRIIGTLSKWYTKKATIKIDGLDASNFNQYKEGTFITSALNFEVLGLSNQEHYVSITFDADAILLDAIDLAEGNTILPYNTNIQTTPSSILTITPEKSTIKVGEEVTAELDIDNIQNIAAEDIKIAYDSEKLQYLGHEELEGIKLIYNDVQNGELRFILASKGESNLITAKTTLLKLKFKGISTGEALADITKGRVSDGIDMEKDLTTEECDQTIITIEGLNDVNNSGEFTLLDLAIDARHLLKDPTLAELSEYNTDVVVNNAIDEADLLEIGKLMLLNSNYSFNN